MPELGEAFNPAVFVDDPAKCPFTHKEPEDLDLKNKLVGVGTTLQDRMAARTSTFHEGNPKYVQEKSPFANPKATPRHPFEAKNQPAIPIDLDRYENKKDVVKYKISCAAHHLIPAQEALKDAQLLEFMMKDGDSGVVKTGKKTGASDYTGKCMWDVGYDVNGSQNGVYLPGSYAVGGRKKGGAQRWIPTTMSWAPPTEVGEDEDEAEDADEEPPDKTMLLTGEVEINPENRKWMYVSKAVEMAAKFARRGYGAQFHDRHEDYSLRVKDILDELYNKYTARERTSFPKVGKGCGKCDKIQEKYDKTPGIPTPFELVQRLNTVSERLESRLQGNIWFPEIYTSAWGQAYIYELEQTLPKKKKKTGR